MTGIQQPMQSRVGPSKKGADSVSGYSAKPALSLVRRQRAGGPGHTSGASVVATPLALGWAPLEFPALCGKASFGGAAGWWAAVGAKEATLVTLTVWTFFLRLKPVFRSSPFPSSSYKMAKKVKTLWPRGRCLGSTA